jgi:hypothetical protein
MAVVWFQDVKANRPTPELGSTKPNTWMRIRLEARTGAPERRIIFGLPAKAGFEFSQSAEVARKAAVGGLRRCCIDRRVQSSTPFNPYHFISLQRVRAVGCCIINVSAGNLSGLLRDSGKWGENSSIGDAFRAKMLEDARKCLSL